MKLHKKDYGLCEFAGKEKWHEKFSIRLLITDGWFSIIFQPAIKAIACVFPGNWLNCFFARRYEKTRYKKTRGVSESYVLGRLIVGVLWLSLINTLPFSIMASPLAWKIGGGIAVYFMLDIFIFTLSWIFVDFGPLESVRRSVFLFFINIFEVALFSSVALILFRCTDKSHWWAFHGCFISIFKFELFKVSHLCGLDGKLVTHLQFFIGVLLIFVVIAGLAGSIRKGREEEGKS